MQKKKTLLQKLWPTRISPELEEVKAQLKAVQDKVEDELTEQLRVLDKGMDDDYGGTSSTRSDVGAVEEEISKSQLQKLLITETWFFIVVNAIAKTIAALPPKVEKKVKVKKKVLSEGGEWEEVEQEKYVDASGSPELDLFQKPNTLQTPVEFYWLILMDLLSTGDCYLYIDDDNVQVGPNNSESRLRQVLSQLKQGVPSGLYRLNPALIEAIPSRDGKVLEAYGMQTDQGYFKFSPSEVLHIKLPNPVNPFYGLAPIVAALKNVMIDRYTKEHFIRFYKQGARLGGVIKTNQKLTKEQLTRLERTFESNYTGRQNHHRTMVLPQGMEYQQIEANPGETSLLEFTRQNKEPILAVYDVPPVKVGILDGASYANANVQLKLYYTDTIMPILKIVEEGINSCPKIMNPLRKMRFKFDLSGVEALREDQKVLSDTAKGMIESGMTVDEVRFKVWGLGPIPGGNKSKVVEGMKEPQQPWVPFGQNSARRGDEKAPGSTQPDNAALSDIEPTTGTFSDRVAQLTAAGVNMGIPFEQALGEAIEQALKEGFVPTAEELADATGPKPEDDKKKEPEEQPESELIHGRFSKEMILEHWKKTAGDGVQPMFDKRSQEVDLFFKRLMHLWLRPVKALRNVKGKDYRIKADEDDISDIGPKAKDIDDFIQREAKKASAAMEEAMKVGYESVAMKIPMGYPDERAKKKLYEISTRNVKSVTGTTRDQLKTVIDDAYARGASMNEIEGEIREKFDEISEGRAKTIVRTEVLTAVSAGQELKISEFKKEFPEESKKLKKAWISAQDEKVRDHHAEYDAMGPVEADYEYQKGLKYPRDVDCDDAGEVINCRCTELYFMEDDENVAIDLMSNNDLLPNEGNNYLEGEKSAEEPDDTLGGPGSGGARPGAGRPRGSGSKPSGGGRKPKPREESKPSGESEDDGETIRRTSPVAGEKEALELVKETQKQFDAIKEENPDLAKGVRGWSSTGYRNMRALQRGEEVADPDAKKMAEDRLKALDKGFKKLPQYEGQVTRELYGVNPAAFKEGGSFETDAYTSFTAMDKWGGSGEKVAVRMVVSKNSSGRAIWGMSNMEHEAEVLVPKGTKYKITKVEDGNPSVVHMEEVGGKGGDDLSAEINGMLDQPFGPSQQGDKGGPGSGGSRPGAGRPRGNDSGGVGAGDKPAAGGSGSSNNSDSRVTQKPNGQITVGKPRSVGEAIAQMDQLGQLHQAAVEAYEKDPSVNNALKLRHARAQLQRGITNGRQIIEQSKR